MDTLVLKLEESLRFKVAPSSVRYYGDYVLFGFLLEYRGVDDWRFLTQKTIRLNISQQMIIQEQIALDQLKTVQMSRDNEGGTAANNLEQVGPVQPTDYFEAIQAIVQKSAKKYFETVILSIYNQQIDAEHGSETIQKGLKAVLNAIEMTNRFGR